MNHLCEIREGKFFCKAKNRGQQSHCGKKRMDKFDDSCQFMDEFTLECRIGKELIPEPTSPIKTKIYASIDEEQACAKGLELGFTGEALRMLGNFNEVELEIEVNKDGVVTAVKAIW